MRRPKINASDLVFQGGTGVFALLLVLLVIGIAVVLWRRVAAVDSRLRAATSGAPTSGIRSPATSARCRSSGARSTPPSSRCSSPRRSRSASPSSSPSFAPTRLRTPLVFLTELLAAIPSIVYGLWGIFVLVPAVRTLESAMPDWLRTLPLFSGPPLGVGMLSAGLILAIMVVPFTSSVAREVLKAVPAAQREGGLRAGRHALGSDPRIALHYARTGIIGAIMLGFGRALGETMAVTMVIGNAPQVVVVAVRAAVHDGGRDRQRVHRGGRRPPPRRAGRDRPGAVHHHA